jgi:uncharacterized membrane protein
VALDVPHHGGVFPRRRIGGGRRPERALAAGRAPEQTALFLRLIRTVLPVIAIGSIATLVFGLWLVHELYFAFWSFWIIAAIVLWLLAGALGGAGGKHQERARHLAERLAAEGDTPDGELRAILRDPRGNAMSWLAGLATLLLLIDMIWKPGA